MKSIQELMRETSEQVAASGTVEHLPILDGSGDYYGSDGFLTCGKCGKHKEYLFKYFGGERYVPTMCECAEEEFKREKAEAESRAQRAKVEEMARYSLVDEKFARARFENAIETTNNAKALKIARRYVERFDEMYENNVGLYFFGEPGTGKTFIAGCIANALMDRNVPVLVTSLVKLTAGSAFGREGEEFENMLRMLARAKLLVLDDFGTETSSDFIVSRVFEVIDTRIGSEKPMVITTNLMDGRSDDLRYRRIFDRIAGVCEPVKLTGESWRRKNAAERRQAITEALKG